MSFAKRAIVCRPRSQGEQMITHFFRSSMSFFKYLAKSIACCRPTCVTSKKWGRKCEWFLTHRTCFWYRTVFVQSRIKAIKTHMKQQSKFERATFVSICNPPAAFPAISSPRYLCTRTKYFSDKPSLLFFFLEWKYRIICNVLQSKFITRRTVHPVSMAEDVQGFDIVVISTFIILHQTLVLFYYSNVVLTFRLICF